MSDDTNDIPFKVYKKPLSTQYDIYLSDCVEGESAQYMDLLRTLDDAGDDDVVNLYLANFGGAVHSGLRIAHSIKNCAAITVVTVEAPCYSMGAILALCGNILVMRQGSMLMFHNYSTYERGKAGEVGSAVLEYNKHFYKSLEYLCYPFLTRKELSALKKDQDVYIHSDDGDLKDRLVRHFPAIKAAQKEVKKRGN